MTTANCAHHKWRPVKTIAGEHYYAFYVCEGCQVVKYPGSYKVEYARSKEGEKEIKDLVAQGWVVYSDTHAGVRKTRLISPEALGLRWREHGKRKEEGDYPASREHPHDGEVPVR